MPIGGYIDGSVIRKARKTWRCRGDGAGHITRQFAMGHHPEIVPGEQHLEFTGQAHNYESGTRHCMACADEFFALEEAT